MPSLKAIRARINSVKNTQKITRAMKLIAAARLRRAQDAIYATRPYAHALEDVIAEIAARAGRDSHPLLVERPLKRVMVVAMSADRGLAGGFNANVNRTVERFFYERKPDHDEIKLAVIGRKGRDYLRRRKYELSRELPGVVSTEQASVRAEELTQMLLHDYV